MSLLFGQIGLVIAYVGPGAGITFLGSFFVLLAAFGLLTLSVLTWPFRFAVQAIRRLSRGVRGETKRVVVLGLDGLDPARTRRLMAAGRLPNLQRLADTGTFSELKTTLPPISPVAWSSFQTGTNPGKHNIFDFLNRDLRTCLPELSSTKITEGKPGWLSWFTGSGASIRLLRKSQPFWKILGDYGIFSTILRVPISFPPEKFFGLSLSAMCTPDLRGTQGSFTLFTTDESECVAATGGLHIAVTRNGDRIDAELPGPPNSPGQAPQEFRVPLRIEITSKESIVLHISGERIPLRLQQDSGWVRISFRCGMLTQVHGLCRFRLESLEPHVRLYASPIHLDPERPAMPISHPLSYSIYLAKLHDSFATLGLAEDTWALNAGAISEHAFLEQAYAIHDERERMFLDALRRMPRGLSVCVFDASDRIQHMFKRHDNPAHPANVGRDTTRHAGVIDDMYARMDDLVGRVAAEIRKDEVLLVLSDHGFCEFRRGVNLNVWLRENGYLTLKDDVPAGDYLAAVDWSKTRAYSFGLSGIYLNRAGREARGIVPAGDAAALEAEIASKLVGLRDVDGARVVRRAPSSRQAYQGPYAGNGPDLIVSYEAGYRASWDNAVGRTDGPVLHDNARYWSGDHCVDPEIVPGVFFSNVRWTDDPRSILDLAPTILGLFGVPVPSYMDGRKMTRQSVDAAAAGSPVPSTPLEVATPVAG
jgi:predicted AlkP superfamily phosphohydrolase/phosphomutase